MRLLRRVIKFVVFKFIIIELTLDVKLKLRIPIPIWMRIAKYFGFNSKIIKSMYENEKAL